MRIRCVSLIVLAVAFSESAQAQVFDSILFNATTNGVGDDPAGQGTNFASSSQLGSVDDEEGAFGRNTGPIEPSAFLFEDGGVIDNGNNIFGDGGETVDSLTWDISSLVVLDGYSVLVATDTGNSNRGTEFIGFSVAGELDDSFDNNAADGVTNRLFSVPQLGSNFGYSSTRTASSGSRLGEIDAIVASPLPGNAIVDTTLFNATTNNVGEGDEPAGLALNFGVSSALAGDTVQDVFGNNNGVIEPNSFIFDGGGVADNGNNTFDAGLETIDFISWDTLSPVSIAGFEIIFSADTLGPHAFRGTEMLNFLVEGVVVDTIDLNGYGTGGSVAIQRIFGGGALVGDDFEVQLTRSTLEGPRLFEINAIVVPEPSSVALLAIGAVVLGLFARKRRS